MLSLSPPEELPVTLRAHFFSRRRLPRNIMTAPMMAAMRTTTPMAMPAAAPLDSFFEDLWAEAVLVLAADVARPGDVVAMLVE